LENRSAIRISLVAIFLIISIVGILGEKIPVNNGKGWDGKNYANLTIHFEELYKSKQIDSYQFQRIFTPAIIYYGCKLLRYPLSDSNIVIVFACYNLVLLCFCCAIFFLIASHLNFSIAIEIIGFSALFLNYFAIKLTPYYPILTDVSAFFTGMVITYLFIHGKQFILMLVLFISHFVFPLLFVGSLPLFFNQKAGIVHQFIYRHFGYKKIAIFILFALGFGIYIVLFQSSIIQQKYLLKLNTPLLPISIACLAIYIWRGISMFTLDNEAAKATVNIKIISLKVIAIISFLVLSRYFIQEHSIPEIGFTSIDFIFNIVQQSIDNPVVFLISHFIYLGPLILLFVLFWKALVKTLVSYGDSAIAYSIIFLVITIGSETRQFIHAYPFFCIMLLLTINTKTITLKQSLLFMVISLIASKCWFTINVDGIFTKYDYANFPDQRYFMSQGPFMNDYSYLLNVVVIFTIAIMLYKPLQFTLKRGPSENLRN